MTRLILIRHGMTDDNLQYRLSGWTDTPLNEAGIRQAECVADCLQHRVRQGKPIHAIYASPLLRAAQTAEIIAERLGLSVLYRDGLKEMNFGKFDGQPILSLYERHKEMVDRALNPGDDEFAWEDGESRPQLYRRIETAIRGIAEAHPEQTVAIVTHAGAIAYFVAGILGKRLSEWNRYHVGNCSLTTVLFKNGMFQLAEHNRTDHVPADKLAEFVLAAKRRLGIPIE
ncbi:histidine phosphatase family protein [Effusibacillus pohliae]|uniref:histidine phosphatase family protein n=1 Tax=Effusibacillus pohliae TaxID=232270 RepID=UPI00035EB0C4|nr:histidine phosphatase family protein [Effusibacillus pohliae]